MRVLILGDMEGVSGITVWPQTFDLETITIELPVKIPKAPQLYQEGRRLYTEDVNAAVRGAKNAGAEHIVMYDHHGTPEPYRNNSLVPELLHPDCEWATHDYGLPGVFLEQGFDAAVLIGQHARAGTPDGPLSHTHTREIRNMWFNDVLVGEIDTYAANCGAYGIPVVCVIGDEAACRQATESLGPGLVTVAVKKGLSRNSAQCIAPVRAREMIEAGVEKGLHGSTVQPYVPTPPVTLKIELYEEDTQFGLDKRAGVTKIDNLIYASAGETVAQARLNMFGDNRERLLSPYVPL